MQPENTRAHVANDIDGQDPCRNLLVTFTWGILIHALEHSGFASFRTFYYPSLRRITKQHDNRKHYR
jgi:hypothetical protein